MDRIRFSLTDFGDIEPLRKPKLLVLREWPPRMQVVSKFGLTRQNRLRSSYTSGLKGTKGAGSVVHLKRSSHKVMNRNSGITLKAKTFSRLCAGVPLGTQGRETGSDDTGFNVRQAKEQMGRIV